MTGKLPAQPKKDDTPVRRLMIVDDLRDFAESLAEVLEWQGYETVTTRSEAEALDALKDFDARVALVDIRLEETDGTDLISKLTSVRPGIHCIMMTAYAEVDTAIRAIQSGAYAYLRKPLRNEELLATLDRCFQAVRLREEKEAAETKLRKRESEYRRLFDNLRDIFYRTDMDGKIVLISPSVQAVLGCTPDEARGKNLFSDFFRDAGECECLMTSLKNGTFPEWFSGSLVAGDGSEVWISASARYYRDEGGEPLGIEGIACNITEITRSEQERVRLGTAVEQAAELIFITDTNGTIQYVNPSFERVTGYSRDEAVGLNPRLLKSGKHDAAFYRQLWGTISRGEVWRGRLVNKKKNGPLYHEEATISPIRDGSNNIINYVAVKRDITNESMLENQLIHVQKMEAIGTLAGGIAHDFNNILSSIMGYTELAVLEIGPRSKGARHMNQVLKASHRAKDLVNQILSFSRREEHELMPVDLRTIVQEAVKLLRASLPTTIDIRLNIDAAERTIQADPTQIHQVLMNIGANASHAMRAKGGILELTLEEAAGDPEFPLQHPNVSPPDYLRLTVSDSGSGMAPDIMKRIFDPYFTTKEKGEGTGLGLAIVHGIIQRHGGHITANSERGKGTRFHIYFPHAQDDDVLVRPIHTGSIPGGNEKILLVDDEEDIVRMEEQMLRRMGYRVASFTSSPKAMEAFQGHPGDYDVLVTDMTMPSMTGDQLVNSIKKIRPDLPVLLCTGYNENIDGEKAKEIGIEEFLIKPIAMRELAEALRRLLDRDS